MGRITTSTDGTTTLILVVPPRIVISGATDPDVNGMYTFSGSKTWDVNNNIPGAVSWLRIASAYWLTYYRTAALVEGWLLSREPRKNYLGHQPLYYPYWTDDDALGAVGKTTRGVGILPDTLYPVEGAVGTVKIRVSYPGEVPT